MKVYVAAGFAEKETVRAIHRRLRARGHEVTVDWTEHEGVEEPERDRHAAVVAAYAERDLAGVAAADLFILLAEPPEGKAMYVELGIALHAHAVAGRPLVYVVGRETNQSIFFYHPAIRRRPSVDAVLGDVGDEAGVAIVALAPERWPEYKQLRLEALAREPAAFSTTLEEARAYPDEEWQRRLGNPGAILRFAERGGRLVGLAGAYRAADGEPGVAMLFGVYLAAEHRGRGTGRRLVEGVLAAVGGWPEVRRVRLNANPAQAAALALYRSLGFAVVGVAEQDESGAGIEVVLERPLA